VKRRWRAVVRAVDGTETGEIGRAWTRWGITRIVDRYRLVGRREYGALAPTGIPEPLPGRPMYSIEIERVRPSKRESRSTAPSKNWAVFHKQFVLVRRDDDVVYLTRWWLVKTPWGGIMLHRMDGPDARTTIHDHPFPFVSIVLRGGYIEDRLDPMRMIVIHARRVRRINVMRREDAHTIRLLTRTPTWTLVFAGRHRRTWGFIEPDAADGYDMSITRMRWYRHDQYDSGHRLDDERSPIKYG
jgi:hypothetical protein